MKENKYFSLREKIPLLILLAWTSLIGYFIWQRANQSDRPPLYDPLSYYEKAKYFWKNAHQGFPQNPLNVEPVVRPPGTVLLSYPLGFNDDYRGFLFRSVFVPFLIWIITILVLVWPKREPNKEKSYWSAIMAVFLLGPLPVFFQFDFGISAHWGLVDSFLASMSALALAFGIKSIQKKSKSLLIFSVFVSSICPFIKPVGCFIFLLIALCWSTICLLMVLNKNNDVVKTPVKFWWQGSILFFLSGIIVLYLGTSSAYLGHSTIKFFSVATSVLNNESEEYIGLPFFISLFYSAVGPQVLVYTSLFIFLLTRYRKSADGEIPVLALLFFGFLFIIIGIWFWVWMTGISQLRYFYPFLFLGFVPLLYCAHNMYNSRDFKSNGAFHKTLKMVCFLPAVNILLLLSILNPNITWQEITGVNINISIHDPGVKTARQFLSLITNEKEAATVYDVSLSNSSHSFASYGFFDHLIHPDVKGFTTIRPIDYARPSTYRLTEVMQNYIIFKPMSHDMQIRVLADSIINSFDEERLVIEGFLNSLTPVQGLQTILEEQDCKLSKITNKIKLMQALEPFLYSRQWRSLFIKENKITPQGWKLFEMPIEGMTGGYLKDTLTQ